MKKLPKLLLAGLMVAAITLTASAAMAAPVFNLDFGQDGIYEDIWTLKPSEVVFIDVYVSNVMDPGLISMGIDFNYDPTQLEVTPGTAMDPTNWPLPAGFELLPGDVIMKGGRLTGLYGDDIRLGTIELHCIAPGTSDLWLFDSDRGGGYDDFVTADGQVLDAMLMNGIQVGTVINTPIPPAVLLLGSGFIGLLGFRRKMRS